MFLCHRPFLATTFVGAGHLRAHVQFVWRGGAVLAGDVDEDLVRELVGSRDACRVSVVWYVAAAICSDGRHSCWF